MISLLRRCFRSRLLQAFENKFSEKALKFTNNSYIGKIEECVIELRSLGEDVRFDSVVDSDARDNGYIGRPILEHRY